MKSASLKIIIAITVLAFLLRVHGINYYSYGDEHFHVYNSLGLASGQLPGNFHRIALFLFYGLFYAVGWLGGVFRNPQEFIGAYFANKHLFYYAGRFFETLAGTGGVLLLYHLGKRMFSPAAGLIAALFLAVSPLAVEISQIARGQALCLFLIIASMYFLYPVPGRGSGRLSFLLSGLCLGAACSIRIYSAVILIPLGYFFFISNALPSSISSGRFRGAGRQVKMILSRGGFWLFVLGAVAIFLASSSEFYAGPVGFFTRKLSIVGIGKPSAVVHIGSEKQNAFRYYLARGFPQSLGITLYVVSALSLLVGLLRYKKGIYPVLALTAIVYILVMGRGSIGAYRYLFPVLPPLFFLAAEFIIEGSGRIRVSARLRNILISSVAIILALGPLRMVVGHNRRNLQKTTQDLSREWIFANLPAGTRIAVERMGYTGPDLKVTPVLDYWIYNLDEEGLRQLFVERTRTGQPSFALKHYIENPPGKKFHTRTISAREVVDIRELVDDGYQYIVTCSSSRAIYESPSTREKYPEHTAAWQEYRRWVEREGELIKTFNPDQSTPGDEIRVYRIR